MHAAGVRGGAGRREPDMALRLRGAVLDRRDLAQVDRAAGMHADDQVADLVGRAQEFAGLDRQHLRAAVRGAARLAVDHRAGRHRQAGGLQGLLQPQQVDAALAQPARVEADLHDTARAADRLHLAAAGHALELDLDRARDALDLQRRGLVAAPQRHAEHRHVVDALGTHDRRQRAETGRQPVLVGVEHVVQAHQRLGARHADLELHRQHRHAGTADRVGVLDAGDLREHLLGRPRDHVLHVGAAGPGEGDQHIGHRDVDLRLFLARCHQHREQAEQQRDDRQQRRDRVGLEEGRHAAGDAALDRAAHGRAPARPARTASAAMRSPVFSPASTSVLPPWLAPARTWRSTKPFSRTT